MTEEQEALERRIAELDFAIQTRESEATGMRVRLGELMREAARLRLQARQITNTEALARIHRILSGQEWGPDTVDEIAEVVRFTGYEVKEPRADEDETP